MTSPDQELPLTYRQIFEKLKSQIDEASHRGLHKHSLAYIESFAYNYLQGLSILSRIRTNPNWQRYLQPCQKLLVQANVLLYPEEGTSFKGLWHALWIRLPAQLWENRLFYLVSLCIGLITAFLGFVIVMQNFEMATVFVPSALRSSHEMDAYLFSTTAQKEMLTYGRDLGVEAKTFFATFLLLNNAKVALLCFVSGFLFGIPTLLILVQTGLMLGALPALFVHGDFWGLMAWLLPHGVPELSAIFLAGGAGLKLGYTMLSPGEAGMQQALKKTIKSLTGTLVICIVLLIWAALVESFIRQSDLPDNARLALAAMSTIPILLLFARAYFAAQHLHQAPQQAKTQF